MYGLGRYLCVLCVLNVEACGTGTNVGEAPEATVVGASQVDVHTGVGRQAPSPDADADTEDAPSSSNDFPDDDESTPDSTQPCTCGDALPGITIEEEDGQLTVGVALTGGTKVAIHVNGQNCQQTAEGLAISGDVKLQLGAAELPLLDAELTVSAGTIHGSAQVPDDVLGGVVHAGDLASIRADVGLGMSSDDGATLDVTLVPSALTLDTDALPLGAGTVAVANPTIVLSASAQSRQIEIRGSLGADASAPWLGTVPLAPAGDLAVTARIVDQSSLHVALEGDLQLLGSSLVCGLTRLKAVTLPSAKIDWDFAGIGVEANAGGALYPALSVLGKVDLAASFAPKAWSIKLCGDGLLEVGTGALEAIDCLELSKEGATACPR